jgi:hypothetical protein
VGRRWLQQFGREVVAAVWEGGGCSSLGCRLVTVVWGVGVAVVRGEGSCNSFGCR